MVATAGVEGLSASSTGPASGGRAIERAEAIVASPHPAPEDAIPALIAAGVLSTADCLHCDIRLLPIGRSHLLYRVERNGRPIASAKLFGPSRGETDGNAAREAAVASLAASVPALAALLPPVFPSPHPGLVLRGWVAGRPAWEGDALAGGEGRATEDLTALSARIMPPLAAMHRATARRLKAGPVPTALRAFVPWGLRLFDGDAPADLWQHPRVAPLLADAAARPVLVAGIRRARGAWREVALVHGDLKHDNLILRDRESGVGGAIALIDWEMARLGDPAWDLAGLMFRPLLDPHTERGGWSAATVFAAATMLDHYATAPGIARPPVAQRLVLFCGAWLLMNLIQYRSTTDAPDEATVARLLATAEACFGDVEALVARLVDQPAAT